MAAAGIVAVGESSDNQSRSSPRNDVSDEENANKVFGACSEDKMAPLPRRHYQEEQDESLEMFCSRTGLLHHTTKRSRTLSAAEDQKGEPGKQRAEKLERKIKVTMNYLFYLPKGYAEEDTWPLLLFLHSTGERGRIWRR